MVPEVGAVVTAGTAAQYVPTSALFTSGLTLIGFPQLEARRHGSGSRGRGDSRNRREVRSQYANDPGTPLLMRRKARGSSSRLRESRPRR